MRTFTTALRRYVDPPPKRKGLLPGYRLSRSKIMAAFYSKENSERHYLCDIDWKSINTRQTCNCDAQFTVDHPMICHMGGFPTMRHGEIRHITAFGDGARIDARARGSERITGSFFDVRVFYPNAYSNRSRHLSSVYEGNMNKRGNVITANELEKSNVVYSPVWFYRQLVAWVGPVTYPCRQLATWLI